jgi:hypothetical protein
MAFAPATVVDPIARSALPYGLFSALAPRPAGDLRWTNGVVWEPLTCDPASGIGDPECEEPEDQTVAIGLPKQFPPGAGVDDASSFAVYGSYVCTPTGHTVEWARDRATEHLLAREEARVEQALWTGDLGNEPNFSTGTLQTGAAVPIAVAIAMAEQDIAENYGSLGVIHMSRGIAQRALSERALVTVGTRLFTMLGTPVIAGAGYPEASPIDGTPGLYIVASPALMLYRSEIFYPSDRPGDLLDRGQNNLHAVAERNYLLGFDECPGIYVYEVEELV